jgi:Ger(x)C family germination protein
MKIAVFRGDPEKIPEVDPGLENTVSGQVVGIMENSRVLADTVSMTLNELLTTIRGGDGTAVIPVLEIEEGKEPKFLINKLALIKDYKLLSYLDAKYIKSFKIITKTIDNGRKLISYKGTIIPFYIFTSTRRIWLEEDGDKLKYRVRIELEGDIEAYEFDKELFDPKIIQEIADEISRSTEYELATTTKYLQQEVGVDYLKFGEYTHKYHNKIYKKYENNWDEAFRNAEINYEVKTDIRRIGTSKK